MLGCLTASLLGLGVIIGCICGLVVPSKAANEDVFIITSAEKIGEIELGEYPQTFVGAARNEQLKNTTLTATGKKYTTYLQAEKVELSEYLLSDGKTKVVKLPSAQWTFGTSGVTDKKVRFTDNTIIIDYTTYFFTVESIKFDLFAVNNQIVAVAQNALGSMAFGSSSDWSQSAIRTFFHNVFASETKLTNYAQVIKHYNTSGFDDKAGLPVTDSFWLPSANEMRKFYNAPIEQQRSATDFVRATATDDRGPYGTQVAHGAVCFLRGATDSTHNTGLDGNGIIYSGGNISSATRSYAHFPAFVLNDATAQYKTEVIAPTCQSTGYTESYWQIKGSDEKFDYQKYDETPMTEHTWGEWETVTENTCNSKGLQKHTCTVCGTAETVETNPDEAKHAYQETVVNPTCTTGGYTEHTCTNDGCTLSYRDNLLPALGHTWGEWQTTQDPTATTVGTAERECSVCHEKETKTIPALSPVTGTTDGGGNNNGTVWLIFGIIAGGVLVLGGGAVSWLFIAGIQRKKKIATA